MLHAQEPISVKLCKKVITVQALIAGVALALLFFNINFIASLDIKAKAAIFIVLYLVILAATNKSIKRSAKKIISDPLDRLSALTDEIISGNYSAHADVVSETEIGSLARNLNFMIDIMAQQNNNLEQKIEGYENDYKKCAAKVRTLEARLKEMEWFRDEYSRVISLDVKTPVSFLLNYSLITLSDMKKSLQAGGDADKNNAVAGLSGTFENIEKVFLRLQKAFLSIFDVSRLESANIEVNAQKANFIEIIDGIVNNFSFLASYKGITIKKEMTPDLSTVYIDVPKIELVLNNLLSNALKFSNPGGTIIMKACFEGENIMFSISDKGVGISNAISEKIFLQNNVINFPGTFGEKGFGVGLKLCKFIVELHGGSFWFDSGEGSTFYFKIAQKY